MKKYIFLTIASLLMTANAHANLILNGSFETNTGAVCDSNLSNVSFTATMANATAYGSSNELDIYNAACFGPAAIDGTAKVHANTRITGEMDSFNFDLASTLVSGASYDLSFYIASITDFGPGFGSIDIGLSSFATSFGAFAFTANSTVNDTWQLFSTTIVAGAGVTHLSVRSGVTPAWMALDGFSLTAKASVPEPATLALLGLGLLGLGLSRRRQLKA